MGELIIEKSWCPTEHAFIAHCVSEDGAMGAGFAAQISRQHRYEFLENVGSRLDQVVYTKLDDTMIAHLITKERHGHKPIIQSFEQAVADFVNSANQYNTSQPWHSPRIGCGLDRLDWLQVEPLLREYAKVLQVDWLIHIPY